jgi:hypothetical protein
VHRARYERAPDLVPIRFADGTVVVPEVKTRACLPRWLAGALAQAAGYAAAGAVPLVVLSESNGPPLALLPLAAFAALVGLRAPPDGEQLLLVAARAKDVGEQNGNSKREHNK